MTELAHHRHEIVALWKMLYFSHIKQKTSLGPLRQNSLIFKHCHFSVSTWWLEVHRS